MHFSSLSSVRVNTNSSGTKIGDQGHYPFGGERNPVATSLHHKFTGQERDSETGLDYFIARHYASNLGRFLQVDPGGLTAVHPINPQTWNWYTYTLNNPLRYIDPSGKYVVTCAEGDNACQKEADRFESQRQANLNSSDADVRVTAEALGGRGDANGVTVSFVDDGDLGEGVRGDATSRLGPDSDGNIISLTEIRIVSGLPSNELRRTIGHEGRHRQDAKTFADSINQATGAYDSTLNLTRYQRELNAYQITTRIARLQNQTIALGNRRRYTIRPNNTRAGITNVINRFLRDPANGYAHNGRGISPQNPGPRMFPSLP